MNCSVIALLLLQAAVNTADPVSSAVRDFQAGRVVEAEALLRKAVSAQPANVRALGMLGVVLDAQKRFEEAEPVYLKAARLAPRSAGLINNVASHYMSRGNLREARTWFERVLSIEPTHTNANLQMALLDIADGRAEAALQRLELLPVQPEVRAVKVQALAAQNKADAAIAAAERDPRVLFSAAMALVEIKAYGAAETLLASALELLPGNFDILYNLGTAAAHAGHYERAIEVYKAALRQRPGDPDTLMNLAGVYGKTKDLQNAIMSLGAARRAAPKRTDILEAIARAFEAAGYFTDAARAWEEFRKLRPDSDAARRERGFALSRAGNRDEAVPELEWYVKRHPDDPVGHFQLGIALTVLDKSRAAEHLGRAIQLNPEYVPALHARGALLHQIGRPADALPDLERVMKLEPDNARALDHLGQVYRDLDRLNDSERVLREAIRLNPNDGPTLMHLGQTLRDLGNEREAAEYLARFEKLGTVQKDVRLRGGLMDFLSLSPSDQAKQYVENIRAALRVSPHNPEYHLRLGMALYDRGEREQARTHFKDALALSPPVELLTQGGRALLQYGEYDLARSWLFNAVESEPAARLDLAIALSHVSGPKAGLAELEKLGPDRRDGDYWLARAQMLDAAGDAKAAAAALTQALAAAPTRADLYHDAALFLIKHEDISQAARLLEHGVRRLPDDPELALLQAIVLEISGKTADAEKALTALQRRWPEWDRPWLVHGILLAGHARPADARRSIEAAIALGSTDSEAWFYLADTIVNSAPSETAKASDAIAKALQQSPDDPYALSLAGRIQLMRGDADAAIRHLKRAVELLPNLTEAHNHLSRALASAGRSEEAAAAAAVVRKLAAEQRGAEPLPAVGKTLFRVRAPR